MKNRDSLIKQKAEEIRKELENWVSRNDILENGEHIRFYLGLKRTPSIHVGSVTHIIRSERKNSAVSDNILQKPLDTLNFPAHLRKRIQRIYDYNNIKTVGDLVRISAHDLHDVRNVGQHTIDLIREKLAELNLRLKND